MHRCQRNSYFCFSQFRKNFNLKQTITLRGMIRRFERRNPRTTNLLKFSSIFILISSLSYLAIPGTSLPFQNQIKKQFYVRVLSTYKWWYLDENIENQQNYIKEQLDLLVKIINDNVNDWQWILQTLSQIVLPKQDKHVLKQASAAQIKNVQKANFDIKFKDLSITCRLNIIMYSSIILNSMIKYQWKILKTARTYNLYIRIFIEHCIQALKSLNTQPLLFFSETENAQMQLSLNIFLYLINFHQLHQSQANLGTAIKQFSKLTSGKNLNFYWQLVLKNTQLTRSFKKLYSETNDQETKKAILTIFTKLDSIYQANNKH